MQTEVIHEPTTGTKVPWNKGKMIGAKPPLRIKNVWSIRTKLQVDGRLRDMAMFNLAIDSKLRGCDVVTLRVEDIAPYGAAFAACDRLPPESILVNQNIIGAIQRARQSMCGSIL